VQGASSLNRHTEVTDDDIASRLRLVVLSDLSSLVSANPNHPTLTNEGVLRCQAEEAKDVEEPEATEELEEEAGREEEPEDEEPEPEADSPKPKVSDSWNSDSWNGSLQPLDAGVG